MALIIVLTAAGFAILLMGYIYMAQDSLIYYPQGYADAELAAAESVAEALDYRTGEGRQRAFYVAPRGARAAALPERIWLVLGGNAARALDWIPLLPELGARESGFLLIDYPGYGRCEGRPSPESIDESVERALEGCAERLGTSRDALLERTAVLGQSLGAAPAIGVAERHGLEKVVLLAPFTTMIEMARRVVGPLAVLLRHRYDNRQGLGALLRHGAARIAIIHGEEDEIVPVEMGRELAAMDPARIQFHAVPGATHNDLLFTALPLIRDAMR